MNKEECIKCKHNRNCFIRSTVGDNTCLKLKEQDQKIDRLNNIINKYRIGIEDMWVDNAGEDTWIYKGEDFLSREEFLDKLKELKENR